MSKKCGFRKFNIHKILQDKFYSKESSSLEKLLHIPSSRNCKLKTYNQYKDINFSLSLKNLKHKKMKKDPMLNYNAIPNILELNESIISLFHKTNYLKNKAKEKSEENKELNDFFYTRFKKFRELEKEKEKKNLTKKNNSAHINPQSFRVFDDLVNKYKERDGILYTKDIFDNKDLYKVTPIVAKDEDTIRYFYLYNYDKYAQKTNLNYRDLYKGKPMKKIDKKETIKFDKLTITKFYKKLLSTTKKKIYQIENKEESSTNKFNYHYKYLGNKDIRTVREIPKLKEEIKRLKSLYHSMQNMKNKSKSNLNIIDNFKTPNNTCKNFFKKMSINNNNESIIEVSKELPTTKKSIKKEGQNPTNKSLININDKNSSLSPVLHRIIFSKRNSNYNRNINKVKNKLYFPSFSTTQREKFINIKKLKEEKSVISQKTKTTFYSANNKENSDLFSPKNKTGLNFYGKNELNSTENTYQGLKRMSLNNKELVLKNTENYIESKGYNPDKVKKGIKVRELYNFFDNIKHIISDYNCKQKVNSLNLASGKRTSDKMNLILDKINDLDKEISEAENQYYLSLLKLKS